MSYDGAESACEDLSTDDCPVRILPVADIKMASDVSTDFSGKTLRLEGRADGDKWLDALVNGHYFLP